MWPAKRFRDQCRWAPHEHFSFFNGLCVGRSLRPQGNVLFDVLTLLLIKFSIPLTFFNIREKRCLLITLHFKALLSRFTTDKKEKSSLGLIFLSAFLFPRIYSFLPNLFLFFWLKDSFLPLGKLDAQLSRWRLHWQPWSSLLKPCSDYVIRWRWHCHVH